VSLSGGGSGPGGDGIDAFLDSIPYARTLGIHGTAHGSELTLELRFDDSLIGNPMLPALHGGVIGAFLETTALTQLAWDSGHSVLPKTIDISFNFLRSGRPRDTWARASITKLGRRVANVHVDAWQDDRQRPIATADGHFLLAAPEDP